MTATQAPIERSELEEAVQVAVAEKHVFSDWPVVLRRAYFDQHKDGIRRELRQQQIVGLVITVVSILLDLVAVPQEFMRGVGLRAALVVAPALLLILFANRIKLELFKLGSACTLIAFATIVVHMASFTDPATATRYTLSTTFLLAMSVLMLPYLREERVGFAVGFTAATILIGVWPHTLPPLILLEHLIMSLLVCGAALVIAVRHADERNRNFLYDLRDSFAQAELEQNVRVLRELSEVDALTGLANRRSFRSEFDAQMASPDAIDHRGVTVMMIDLDHFKRFNDEHGHQAGDRALRSVGRCLEEGFRQAGGIVARFGGEEFIAAYRSTSVAEAVEIAQDVCASIRELEIRVRESSVEKITTSIGLATSGPGAKVDLAELTDRADRALYHAKRNGRDQAVASERIELRVDRLAG